MMNDLGHQFIKYISPKYKQKCIWCGATDAPGDDKFNKLCPDRDVDDFIEELRQTVCILRFKLKEANENLDTWKKEVESNHINSAYIKSDFALGERVRKKSGSSWRGKVVGYYSTLLTPIGCVVESDYEPGSVQIYPQHALEPWPGY